MTSTIDEVGPWTEVKLRIVKEYASVFSKILSLAKIPVKARVYIDGFAGGGLLLSETTGQVIAGTPLGIVNEVSPPFDEYHFVEINPKKVAALRALIGANPKVQIHSGDSNEILVTKIFPSMPYRSFRKGLLYIDPYGLDVDWGVIHAAGQTRSVDLLMNFPIMDINRKVLRRDSAQIVPEQAKRMTRFWGSDEWRAVCYDAPEPGLFGDFEPKKKPGNEAVVRAYCDRLRSVAGFAHVSNVLPMKNLQGFTVYYLIGASRSPKAIGPINSIFKRREKEGTNVSAELDRVD